ncbi:aminodeoxychorismate/anthranilate synthase component II [Streptococcus catagoni]|uniref:aminodeoxychorismate/anthranilate synthase component II n=1 Tax=Streptococcus catagoni TaxID=2654874 RepID=UPI001407C46F|nr:aminodeoxychorismate/anthranilate synthase component II [Streptococcus catagoni]
MILLIDNYDSFTYNLAQYLSEKAQVQVLKNDDPKLFHLAEKAQALVFSPGPGWPEDAGQMPAMIKQFAGQKPILGVCLGHQAIAQNFGGQLCLASEVMHGKQSRISVTAPCPLFEGLPTSLTVMRYHSIIVDSLPDDFIVTARDDKNGDIMAFRHKDYPLYGMQFHPESIGSPQGMAMIEHFVDLIPKHL